MAGSLPELPFSATKRKYERYTEDDKVLQEKLTKEIDESKKTLKPKLSYDAEYFHQIAERSDLELKRLNLVRKKSRQDFLHNSGLDADWENSEKASKLNEEKETLTLRRKLFKDQADQRRIEAGNTSKTMRGYFIQLYTSSARGLGISPTIAAMGQRDTSVQDNFRKALIKACRSESDVKGLKNHLWCPVIGGYVPKENARAAHIFPYASGQEAMTSIFGDGGDDKMFDTRNGLILSMWAEKKISDGEIVIVPLVSDNASKEETAKWAASDPKEYKVRIVKMSPDDRDQMLPVFRMKKTWGELDGAKVQFKSDHRPRARYLYWQYCQTTLRQSWLGKNQNRPRALQSEFKKPFWGTAGSYMKRSMLLAFVEEMGHQYESLLDGAVEDVDANSGHQEVDCTALAVANEAIADSLRRGELRAEMEKEENDEEDEEDDEEYDEDAEYYRRWGKNVLD
ncbi:MAG: hypothetical protein HETSPECPRED_005965 [Heterodermia speciosa]|uniref:HNH nuclease domain-containing protein n=1 Tax=Heterodermia speciosa TaxID=116794 RepID=A0A8H3EHM2_9LECA|nr:MAG: hypothetical protein HETSPECPRED_005965 [Heterodermia speciosa]